MSMTDRWKAPGQCALVVLLTLAAYVPAMRGGFVFDDSWYITDNPTLHASDALRRFWFTTEAPDYYPLTWTLWRVQWQGWGDQAAGYHAVNVLLHAANALLVWAVLRRLDVSGAFWAALAFALHPVNVATVAWISEQKNTLAMLFYLISILLYLRFDAEGGRRFYAASLAAFLLALLSKTAVVMLPVVLLLCVFWRRGRVAGRDAWRTAPFFALSLGLGLVTVWFQHHRALGGHVVFTDSVAERLARAGTVPWFYLSKTLLPIRLSAVYPKWEIDTSDAMTYLPGLALAVSAALCWWKRRVFGRAPSFALGYFVVTLFPVLGFLSQGFYQHAWVADPWPYFSMPGALALVAAGTVSLGRRLGRRGPWGAAAGIVALALLGAATWKRAHVYQSDEALWTDTLAQNPRAALAHNNLGFVRADQGEWDEAIARYETALLLRPDLSQAENNLGVALAKTGRLPEAVPHYEAALRLRPEYPEAENNLGNALIELGRAPEAAAHFERALALRPEYAEAHNGLAGARALDDRTDEAIEEYRRAVQIRPDYMTAHYNLALLLDDGGHPGEAVPHYEAASRLAPDAPYILHDLGKALVRAGRPSEAVARFEAALVLDPENADIRGDLAAVGPAPPDLKPSIGGPQKPVARIGRRP